jgi:hypothetical protein
MDARKSMREVAEAILLTYEMDRSDSSQDDESDSA